MMRFSPFPLMFQGWFVTDATPAPTITSVTWTANPIIEGADAVCTVATGGGPVTAYLWEWN
ncbi:unnamed protein product, partial [marine sediment metagenome]